MDSNLGRIAELGGKDVLTHTWHLLIVLFNHTRSYLRADSPACRLQFRLVDVGVVLAGRRLEKMRLFSLQVAPYLCADLDGRLMLLDQAGAWRVVPWSGLLGLLLFLRRVMRDESHGVGRLFSAAGVT